MITTLSIFFKSIPFVTSLPSPEILPSKVSAIALGCSKISLSIKCSKPPRSAALASQEISYSLCGRVFPARFVITIASAVISATSSWPSSSARLVCEINAETSEARKFSPSPTPTTSGEFRRAPTIRPG